ncbi:MAG: flagellin [Spirochaetales bacterium]|nr:flagellin [Spirochaetales bacterium]
MIINHNMSAIFAHRQLKFNNLEVSKDMEKLSSGYRINRASDDASGLAVSEKMRTQIRGMLRAEKNAQDGISFIQTAEGYLQESQNILQRIRELAIQSSNGIYSDEDRLQIQVEVSQLVDEVNRVASHAQFNGMNLLTGRFARDMGENLITGSMWFHMGANMDQRERVYIHTMTAQALGIQSKQGFAHAATFISLSTPDRSNMVIGLVDEALQKIGKQRADLGAYQTRLEHTMTGLLAGAENLQASESRIRDADMAEIMVSFVKNQILVQSSTAMLAQANTKPQTILQLFQ